MLKPHDAELEHSSYMTSDHQSFLGAEPLAYSMIIEHYEITIPVNSATDTLKFGSILIGKFSKYGLRDADFKKAFYELNDLTAEFQDFTIEQVGRVLQQSEKNSKESFQAFGVTFPIETTSRWGALLIVALQLYLWLHLAEFRRRDFSISDIAWIGAYQQAWPRAIFCLTGLIIPVCVVLFLGVRSFVATTEWYYALYFELAIIASGLLAGSSTRDNFQHQPTNPPTTAA